MLESCTDASTELILSDEIIENSEVLRLFLDAVVDLPSFDLDSAGVDEVLGLIKFCQKYDCATILLIINPHVKRDPGAKEEKETDNFDLFFYALALGDIDSAHRLLPMAARMTWSTDGESKSIHRVVNGASVMCVNSMSTACIERLSNLHWRCLVRASRLRTCGD